MKFWTREVRLLIELSKLDFYKTIGTNTVELFNLIDWDEFLQLAAKHDLLLVIENNLEKIIRSNLSVNISLKHFTKIRILARVLRHRLELIDEEVKFLTKKFNSKKLKVVIMKGLSMNRIYQRKYLRYYGDIDFLIVLDDVEDIHNVLLGCEYSFDANISINGKLLKEVSKQTYNCIGNYSKKVNDVTINIDLHKADRYNTWNLLDFYNASCKEEENYYFNIVDSFIFSCFHAWHHYPRVVSIRLETFQASLKDYVDIRESYLYIKEKGMLNELYYRINMLGCKEIVNNMLYLTERLYSQFCVREGIITCEKTVENDCNNNYLVSYFERRLFYPSIEKKLLDKYINKEVHNSKEFIECKFFEKALFLQYDNKDFWQLNKRYSSSENVFYDEPYGTSIVKKSDYKFSFSLAWDYDYFIIKIKIFDNDPFFGQEDYYNPVQDCIKFIFNDDWKEIFTLQIKDSGSPIMFIEGGDIFQITKLVDNMTFFSIESDCYSVITNIPWRCTNINVERGEIIPFYFNIIVRNKEWYCTNTLVFNDQKRRLIKLF